MEFLDKHDTEEGKVVLSSEVSIGLIYRSALWIHVDGWLIATMRADKLLVIGLDGYEASIADRLISEGRLPNLALLKSRSSRFFLEHGKQKYSGLAWEHFATGMAPELSGRWSGVAFDPHTYQVVQKATTFEPLLARVAFKSVVFDAPYFPRTGARAVASIGKCCSENPLTLDASNADLAVIWQGSPLALMHKDFGLIGPAPFRRTGGHTGGHGVFYAKSCSLPAGDQGIRSSFDVAPTILELLGQAIPSNVSGHSLLAAG